MTLYFDTFITINFIIIIIKEENIEKLSNKNLINQIPTYRLDNYNLTKSVKTIN